MTSKYLAKYAFAGNPAQNQLSFPTGATIIARDGQDGKPWFWGNYMGRDGWFPPTYVTKMTAAPAATASRPMTTTTNPSGGTMQNKMAGVSFTSSMAVQNQRKMQQPQTQQHQTNPLLSMNSGSNPGVGAHGMNASNQQSAFGASRQSNLGTGFGITAATGGFQSGIDDPFAALESSTANTTLPTLTPTYTQPQTVPSVSTNAVDTAQRFNNQVYSATAKVSGTNMTTGQTNQIQPNNAIRSVPQQSNFSSQGSSQGVNPFKSGGGISLTMSPKPQSTLSPTTQSNASFSQPQKSTFSDKISAAFEKVTITPSKKMTNDVGTEVSINDANAPAVLHQDVSQKKLIEDQLAKKAADEEARVKREKEDAWEKKVQNERERRLQQSNNNQYNNAQNSVALPSSRAEGIGSSGSNFGNIDNSQLNTASLPFLHPRSGKFFDPFAFISDSKGEPTRKFNPIYRVEPFWALLNIESYVKKMPKAPETKTVAAKYDQLAKAMSFMCHIVQENERFCAKKNGMDAPLSFLKANQLGMEACIKMITSLPHSAGASGKQLDQLFLNFINAFLSVISKIEPHQQIVLPGGWQQPEGKSHICLYIVRNCGGDRFSFTICNTGDGLEYHPSSFDQSSGLQLKQLAMTIWDIPSERLLDSSFWVLLFRMQVYPDKRNCASLLYEKLLPALNSRPLWSNLDLGPAEYLQVPDLNTSSQYHFLSKLALTTIPAPGSRPSKFNSLLVMNAAVDLALRSIEDAQPGSMDPEDTRILKLSGRNLASYSSTIESDQIGDNVLGVTLTSSWDLLDSLLKKINFSSSKPMDQHSHGMSTAALSDSFAKGAVSSLKADPGAACFPLFGRFRRDNYENVVKELMGEQRPDPILVPVVLTDESMPPVATDFQTASSSLQRICHACSLLLHQVQQVKNAPAFVASAAQHVLTVTLPMPHLDPRHCFWRKNPMRRETQVNLLFLIRRMCRIYSAATTCVQQSRGLVAIRTTAFACAACIADAITRVTAIDDPSPFALHFSGNCEGPTEPFSIEAGSFETLAANMPIFDAQLTSMRCLCLDYFRGNSVKMDGSKRPTIFNFDKSMKPTKGDFILIDQLSIQLALPRPFPKNEQNNITNAASLISGKNGSMLEVLPEMEYFRDIIFHFKHSVSGKAAAPSDITDNFTWLPHHATLKWTTKPSSSEDNSSVYSVAAFRNTQQEFVHVEENSTSKSAFRSFMRFFGKGKEEQRKLSAADPTNIVNSCGEKFLKTK